MNNEIIGKLNLADENIGKQTINYLERIGIGRDEYKKKDINYLTLEDKYIIEFKEKPFILKTLEYNNFFLNNKNCIDILSISEYGISFFVASREIYGEVIFVPIGNINCIHTIEKEAINRYICLEKTL